MARVRNGKCFVAYNCGVFRVIARVDCYHLIVLGSLDSRTYGGKIATCLAHRKFFQKRVVKKEENEEKGKPHGFSLGGGLRAVAGLVVDMRHHTTRVTVARKEFLSISRSLML